MYMTLFEWIARRNLANLAIMMEIGRGCDLEVARRNAEEVVRALKLPRRHRKMVIEYVRFGKYHVIWPYVFREDFRRFMSKAIHEMANSFRTGIWIKTETLGMFDELSGQKNVEYQPRDSVLLFLARDNRYRGACALARYYDSPEYNGECLRTALEENDCIIPDWINDLDDGLERIELENILSEFEELILRGSFK